MNQRGEYGTAVSFPASPRRVFAGQDQQKSQQRLQKRSLGNAAMLVGTGLLVGLVAWPQKEKSFLGAITFSAAGSMVAVGLTESVFGGL